jgi:membrane protein
VGIREQFRSLRSAVWRVVPTGVTQAQAIAFVMFLCFFPVLLLGLGLLSLLGWTVHPELALPAGLREVLPETGTRVVAEFFSRVDGRPGHLIVLGLLGTVVLGAQTMAAYVDGFAMVWRSSERLHHAARYGRALQMLGLTVLPWMTTIFLTMLGRELRSWMVVRFGGGWLMKVAWGAVYQGLALGTGLLTLIIMYHLGQPVRRSWRQQVPGAIVATVLWWMLNVGFSLYMRHVPYSLIYGSLATVIGLMVWMYFVALVVLVGAAYNAEVAAVHVGARARLSEWETAARTQ